MQRFDVLIDKYNTLAVSGSNELRQSGFFPSLPKLLSFSPYSSFVGLDRQQ